MLRQNCLNFGLSILLYIKNVILRHQWWTQYLILFFCHMILNKSCRIFQNDKFYFFSLSENLKITLLLNLLFLNSASIYFLYILFDIAQKVCKKARRLDTSFLTFLNSTHNGFLGYSR